MNGLRVTRVVVWRHGRTTWNAQGRFQGQADPPLDQIGAAQSRQAARYLAVDPPDLILTSDLLRATSTADALRELTGLPVIVEPRLREIDLGSWQGLTRAEVDARYPEQYAAWLNGRMPIERGGETRAHLDDRVLSALRDIRVEHVVLVTHGGTSRSIIETLLGIPQHGVRWLGVLGNCHWSQLQHKPGGWQLLAHNRAPDSALILHDERAGEDADAGARP